MATHHMVPSWKTKRAPSLASRIFFSDSEIFLLVLHIAHVALSAMTSKLPFAPLPQLTWTLNSALSQYTAVRYHVDPVVFCFDYFAFGLLTHYCVNASCASQHDDVPPTAKRGLNNLNNLIFLQICTQLSSKSVPSITSQHVTNHSHVLRCVISAIEDYINQRV